MPQQDELPSCEVVILTALGLECQAVLAHLQDIREIVHPQGTIYYCGHFLGANRIWNIAVAEIGMGGPGAAAETERAINSFHPILTLFVGIAGGVKDVGLGDVVAATKVYAYEVGKAALDFEPRPEVWRASYALEQRVRAESQKSNWLARLGKHRPDPAPHIFVGALAAGEKVISSKQSSTYQLLRTHYGDALAVEMEGHGFLQAVRANQSVHALVIRGISDLIEKKADADAAGSQPTAAQHAAAFAFEVLARFTLPRAGPESKWKPPLHRPLRAEHFIDREEEQSWLQNQLKLGKAVTLCGPGGMGKTALIAEVLWKLFPDDIPPESFPDGLFFHSFYQQSEVAVALEQIARTFGENPLPTPALAARRALNGRKALLVFDGAEEADDLRHILEVCAGQAVLITSRRRTDAADLQAFRDLSPLLTDHAVTVVQAWSQEQTTNEPVLRQICRLVGNLPLALRLAGRYLALNREEVEEYLQWLKESPLAALDQGKSQYESVPVLLDRSIGQVSDDAQQVLMGIGLLAPVAFDRDLIAQVLNLSAIKTRQALNELQNYGLLLKEKQSYEVSHILIHIYAREALLIARDYTSRVDLIMRFIQLLSDRFSVGEEINPAIYEELLPHVQVCQKLMDRYDLATVKAAFIFTQAGHYLLYTKVNYVETEPLYKHALAICERVLGPAHPDTATSLSNLATLYQMQGRYNEEEPLLKRALTIRVQVLGKEHPDTATSLNNLASLYRSQGKFEQAGPLYEQALTVYKKVRGMEHSDTATCLNNLGSLYQLLGRYEDAEKLLQQAREIREQVLGLKHLDTASSFNNLATLYQIQMRNKEAEPLLKKASAICKRALGPEHPVTAANLNNLGAFYLVQGKVKQAELPLKSALMIREQVLGMGHPETAVSLNNLATLYRAQGRYEEEESLLKSALAIREQVLGPEHIETATSLNNLGVLYQAQGRNKEAEPLLKRALAIYKKALGPEHPSTVSIVEQLQKMEFEQEEIASIQNLLNTYSKNASPITQRGNSLNPFSAKMLSLRKKNARSLKRKIARRSRQKNKKRR